MFTKKTSLIIPTKDRSDKIKELINKLYNLNLKFSEIIIVDSSKKIHSINIKKECQKYNLKYFHTKASTSYQRNFGLTKMKQNDFVMFMDDDVDFFDETFDKMNQCISKYGNHKNIIGFGFNQIENIKNSIFDNLKKISIIKHFDIYPAIPGKIAKSGWHSKILNLKKDVLADWVFTTLCIFKMKEIKNLKFDETYGEYSYLEDLDFSLNLTRKNKKIYISSKAKFLHPENIDRSSFNFGIIEIVNRYKIIKKYNLSKKLFIVGALLRFLMSLVKSLSFNKNYFFRSMGNIYSLFVLQKNK